MKRQLLALALLLPTPALADDQQLWTTASVSVPLSGPLSFSNELVLRFSDNGGGLYELENAAMLNYRVNSNLTASAGYVHDPNYAAGKFTVMERRARQQIAFDKLASLGASTLSGRLRLEQRWRDGRPGTGWRTRPQLKLAVPMGDVKLNLASEAFINLNNTGFQTMDGLDRFRNSASISFPLSKKVGGEIGYLEQHKFVSGGPDTDDHALTVSLSLKL